MQGKMGFQAGEGLGKFGQGRSTIVKASTQRGRRGLGFEIEGLEAEDVEWVETEKEVRETVSLCICFFVPANKQGEFVHFKTFLWPYRGS